MKKSAKLLLNWSKRIFPVAIKPAPYTAFEQIYLKKKKKQEYHFYTVTNKLTLSSLIKLYLTDYAITN